VHVDDVARALVAAVGKPGIFNIATGVKTEVKQIFDDLPSAAGTSLEPQLAPLRARELQQSCLDPTRAGRDFGWRAETDLAEGLKLTYDALVAEFGADRQPH
jgi:UDP-glucose 4-epimerase